VTVTSLRKSVVKEKWRLFGLCSDKIVAHMVDSQVAAWRTFEKLGFHKEAELPGHVTDIHGKRRNLLIYANEVSHIWSAMESLLGDFRPDRATR
jgi:hypothetical protein